LTLSHCRQLLTVVNYLSNTPEEFAKDGLTLSHCRQLLTVVNYLSNMPEEFYKRPLGITYISVISHVNPVYLWTVKHREILGCILQTEENIGSVH
jgi:hypothetical protein